ncbi:MAG: hypothetical protein ACPGFA_00610 [Pikeienuella sp.]
MLADHAIPAFDGIRAVCGAALSWPAMDIADRGTAMTSKPTLNNLTSRL